MTLTRPKNLLILLFLLFSLSACDLVINPTQPMASIDTLNLERFMGDWYVMANIPTPLEEAAFNAIKRYTMREDGSIEALLSFREGGNNGNPKHYKAKGFVRDESNARWGIQPIWPIRMEYLVIYLSDDYMHAVVGRSKRDYVWILSRRPHLSNNEYQRILGILDEHGYNTKKIQRVGQSWPEL